MADWDQKNFQEFIREVEGQSDVVYDDHKGNPSIGLGANLNSVDAQPILRKLGINAEDVIDGKRKLSSEEQQKLFDEQVNERLQTFQKIRERDFPNAELNADATSALMSLYYNNPQLIGPNIRKQLNNNDDQAVAKEILLKSNKNKLSGVMKRRLMEARKFLGSSDKLQELATNLTDDELIEMSDLINKIDNIHERERTLKEYPFLRPFVKSNFKKLLGE